MSQPGASEIGVGFVIADTYEVTELIGQGGMGAVWAASHRRLPGKRVAVKVLLGANTESDALARFKREAEIASRIGHPNIIEVLDFHTLASGTPYMILEFLDGESLASRLKRGPIPLAQTLEIVRQVGSALHAAHREQVVHRDLKPDNIFLCPTDSGGVLGDRVKVLDFGISKIRNSSTVQTQESALLGTPQYMSPEQAFGRNKSIDQRTDVWALGTIVYEMLTGTPAFNGDTLAAVILSIVHEAAPSLKGRPGVPDAVVRAVDRALQKESEQRFPDVASFIAELTGKPLQTLDRKPIPSAVVRAVDALGSTAAGAPAPLPGGSLAHGSTQAASAVPSTTPSLATQPRGEVFVPPTHQTGAPTASRTPLYIGIGAGVLGLGAALFFGLARRAEDKKALLPDPNQGQVFAAAQTGDRRPAGEVAAAPAVAAAPPAAVQVAAAPAADPTADVGLQDGRLGAPGNGEGGTRAAAAASPSAKIAAAAPSPKMVAAPAARVKAAKESLPPEVVAELDAAEQALSGGDTANALHLARKTLTVQKSGRAFSVITRAYCRAGDLGNAKANFNSVSGAERSGVVRACKKYEIDLK
jgi:eukaryotic-like serine/threonine-protein kinase